MGTNEKIRLFDSVSGLHVELCACGNYNFKIESAEKFLFNLIGLSSVCFNGTKIDDVALKLRPLIVSVVKAELAETIRENSINVLEIDEHIKIIGDNLCILVNKEIEKFGICITDFVVTSIITLDNDSSFKRMK